MGLGLISTCEGRFWGWGYFGLARDDFGAGAILDLRGTILGLGLIWTCEGRFWGWGYFGHARDDFGARANLDLRGTILELWGWGYFGTQNVPKYLRDIENRGKLKRCRPMKRGLGMARECEHTVQKVCKEKHLGPLTRNVPKRAVNQERP